MTKKELLKKVIWDYDIDENTFWDVLHGKKEYGWLTQEWALIRVIERLQYYDLLEVITLETIVKKWPAIKNEIRFSHIKKGMDYVIRKYTLSSSK